MTKYVVLKKNDEGFAVIGVVDANGPEQAVRKVTADSDAPEATSTETYAAVPQRNWTIVARTVEVPEPRITISVIGDREAQRLMSGTAAVGGPERAERSKLHLTPPAPLGGEDS